VHALCWTLPALARSIEHSQAEALAKMAIASVADMGRRARIAMRSRRRGDWAGTWQLRRSTSCSAGIAPHDGRSCTGAQITGNWLHCGSDYTHLVRGGVWD
jgi:hypothetical protein